ncbi:Telomerase reverse transcriptase [Glugoides intestinalis]
MQGIVNKLRFQSLEVFIKEKIGFEVEADGIFIKCETPIPFLSQTYTLTCHEILAISREQCDDGNQLCQGYSKSRKQWHSCNTTSNIFKSKQWDEIFKRIGSEYSLFLLKNATIVQKIGKNYILLCGDVNIPSERKKEKHLVKKEILFRGKPDMVGLCYEKAIENILGDSNSSGKEFEHISKAIQKAISKYQKLPLKAIFKSYLKKHILKSHGETNSILQKQVEAETIGSFLFLISKKFLRPIFDLRSFKVLKGKIVLFLKRNMYETLSCEELSNHFLTSKFKLFSQCPEMGNSKKIKIIKNLIRFLFNSVFIKVVGMFFYSTTTSFSKHKIFYFMRSDWNIETGKALSEYLKSFEPCEKSNSFATLRPIPKENGFRIVTNCSSYTSRNCKERKVMKVDGASKKGKVGILSFKRLTEKYNDICNILLEDNDNKSNNKYESDNEQYGSNALINYGNKQRKYNAINTQIAILAPITKNMALSSGGFSLLRHFHVLKPLFSYLKTRSDRLILMKVDLEKCFDNIHQSELIKVVEELLLEEEYYYQEFGITSENTLDGNLETKYIKESPSILYPMNIEEAQSAYRGPEAIIKENRIRVISKSDALKKLRNTIENTIVFYQNSYYRKKKGIPQGCTISSFLCSIYLSFLDREFPNLDWFIRRFVDDFLIITDNPDHLKDFFLLAEKLSAKGFTINPEKIMSNIDLKHLSLCEIGEEPKFISDNIDWCGIRIYDRKTNIKPVCNDPFFRNAVSIAVANRGTRIFGKLKKSFYIKIGKIFINRSNGKLGECIFDSIYFICRRLRILLIRIEFINQQFIEKILIWCVEVLKDTIKNRNILFDEQRIDEISEKAISRSDVRSIKKRKPCF